LRYAVETLERLGVRYALVGSLASSTMGEARFTNDIDIVVELDVVNAALLCDAFADPEFSTYKPAIVNEVSDGRMFNIIHMPSSNKIDFMLADASNWSQRQLDRRLRRDVLDAGPCYVAAPEDVILGKLLYYREGGSEKHLRDISGILQRSGELVDRAYVDEWSRELGVTAEWRSILDRLSIE
jgi:hypothetical protein